MRPKSLAALVLPLALVACGGSTPTAPTGGSTRALDIVTGTYVLTVTMSQQGEPVCDNGTCASVSLCIGSGGPPSPSAVRSVVRLERFQDSVTVRPEDASASFRMELRLADRSVTGTASGQLRDGNGQLTLLVGPSLATGTVLEAASRQVPPIVSGKIDGPVGIDGYSCSNNGHKWTLVPS